MKKYLDLIFDGRVKDYGAYQLRVNYGKNLMVSTIAVCSIVSLLFVLPLMVSSKEVVKSDIMITTEYLTIPPLEEKPKEVIEPKKLETVEKKSNFRSNVRFTDIEVTDDEVFDNLKTQEEMWRQKIGYDNSDDSSEVFKPFEDNIVEVKKEEEKIFTFAEEMPKYNGDLYQDLSKLITYPEFEKSQGLECLLYITFVVDKNGDISDIKVLRPCEESSKFSEVATKAVDKLGKFTPAKMNGNPVSLRMTIPVKFSLR
jgi:protein TonB